VRYATLLRSRSSFSHLLVSLDGFSLLDVENLLDVLALVWNKLGQVQDDLAQKVRMILGLQ
jgi:hypothetical protein